MELRGNDIGRKGEGTPGRKKKRNRFTAEGGVRYPRKITADTDIHRFAFLESCRYGSVDDIMSILKMVHNRLQKIHKDSFG